MSDMSKEWVGNQQPPQQRGSRRVSTSTMLFGAVALGVVLLGASAAFAVQALSGGGSQPESAVPDEVALFASIDLDPSAEQKVNAVQLLRRVPEFEDQTGISSDKEDLRKTLYEALVEDAQTTGSDGQRCPSYEDGVQQWLGDRAGFGAMPAADGGEPHALAAVQVTDAEAAKGSIEALATCVGETSPGVAFAGDYALVAETQQLADDFADAAADAPLADNADYLADMDAVGGKGIVSGWANLKSLVDATLDGEEAATAEAFGMGGATSVAMAMRAGPDNLELTVAANGEVLTEGSETTSFGALPESTMFGFGFTGGAERVQAAWEKAQESLADNESFDAQELADLVQAQTGFVVPDDLATLFGDDFVFALDAAAVDLDESGQPDPSTLRMGMRTSSELDDVEALTTHLEAALAGVVPVELIERESDRGTVVAFNDEYAEALAASDGLTDSENYQAAVANHDAATGVLFADFDLMLEFADKAGAVDGALMADDDRKTLEVLRSFGVSGARDGDYTTATMRLVFD